MLGRFVANQVKKKKLTKNMVEHSNFGKGLFNQKRSIESKAVSDIFKPTISHAKKSRDYSE